MAHAAALIAGLAALWITMFATSVSVPALVLCAGAVLAALLWTARFGGVDSESAPHWRWARLAPMIMRQLMTNIRGAGAVARRAIAADVTLRPALLRIRMRQQSEDARATFANFINAAPGIVVVDIDSQGLLAHVIEEESVDASDLGDLESTVIAAVDGARA
ncbi:MAG: Na+/H+ antiporter subunit E [Caulobacterales bacterium]